MRLDLVRRLNDERAARRAAIVETVLATGEQRLIREGEVGESLADAAYGRAFRTGRSATVDDGRRFLNVHVPPVRIVVIGAVHISQALSPMARLAGYDLEIVDPRTAFATPERFPDTRLTPDWPDLALAARPLDPHCALVALTHDPKIDDPALAAAFAAKCFYIGALGSRKTHARRVERLIAGGQSAEDVARIEAPIGLDIGAEGPGEIAVAILASIVAALRQRPIGAPSPA